MKELEGGAIHFQLLTMLQETLWSQIIQTLMLIAQILIFEAASIHPGYLQWSPSHSAICRQAVTSWVTALSF